MKRVKLIRDNPKKRRPGRPKTTGRGELLGVRLHARAMADLDRWIAGQDDAPSRPEAIRRLIAVALTDKPPLVALRLPEDFIRLIDARAKAEGATRSEVMRD